MLQDKVALITGSNRGIGFAVAKKFAEQGADIVISGTNQESIDKAVAEIQSIGRKCIGIACNVADSESCQNLIAKAVEEMGKLDIIVNNAGVTRDTLLMKMSEEDFDFVIDVNLKGTFNICKAGIPKLPKKGGGRVINMSSVVGIMGNPGQTNYAASKAGMIGFTRSLAKEYARRKITVNAIAPGYIQTEMTDQLDDKLKDQIKSHIPMRELGAPEDVANIALFLASNMASYVTGQVIQVDGGMIMA